ncbi:peptidoglycan DD-metalloendopeptidase family protein [Castellaniella daejeonensis]|jgi:septal ring factor EnvC (AmiA/AmiB activator)|uniref:Peptidoglycan DD-metalloendopeptidase family protein n=1 Tax=Castellaniella daejeonensis TaxID=659013 RepID=A0ABN0TY06_9BURK|nr:peptidoglycan DD-metalloendopeptidase family protein [Castellaniella sp.]HET8702922.1 peptidoglycan DD-metalloendopeptidase family protein [Castellaniella sp.]
MSLILRAPGRPRSLRRIRAPRWPVHALCLAAALACQAAWADSALEARQARAREDRAALRTQIEALQKRIESSESSREDASRALQASEQAISDISRELAELDRRETVLQDTLRRLDAASSEQSGELERQQQALAAQLRAQYASGLSPWTALLSGRDPQEIGRELAWLAYVTRSRTQALDALRATLDRLAGLRQQTDDSRRELDAVRADVRKRREDLQDQQAQRREVLEKIRARLDEERGHAKQLQARDARLGNLIQELDAEIARAEARRQAALKAEAERRAREQAERARAEKARREQERARAAEQARRIREQAEHHVQEEQPAPQQPDEAGQAETQAPPPKEPQPGGAAAARIEPEGGFPGLNKGLPHPVAGQVQGRFGTQRPEGGLWRGIVLRAPAGTPVRAVAPGRVVYAHWLSGFGNLLIIDHGKQYLSIYAYNQSLLRQVGDVVARGDEVARVGATGGQVEPGLYFELRHNGAPINPEIWMRQDTK